MPWFEATNGKGGWHWTMGKLKDGHIASHFQPAIGIYDSLDPWVVEMQVGLMKIAGFDGVLADWYGSVPFYDYASIHARTNLLFKTATEAGLKICLVYEDQSVGNPIKAKIAQPKDSAKLAEQAGHAARPWLNQMNWWHLDGKPALLVFGPQFFQNDEWSAFMKGTGNIALLSLHRVVEPASGAYDWPIPSSGLQFTLDFASRSKNVRYRMPVAYPRFRDAYEKGEQKGFPVIEDDNGATYLKTLRSALAMKSDAVQVATWNDWQEGTQIEPSKEYGLRDLMATQRVLRESGKQIDFEEEDLNLPLTLYRKRKSNPNDPNLDAARRAIFSGDVRRARILLKSN
jgi:hypothetical protein